MAEISASCAVVNFPVLTVPRIGVELGLVAVVTQKSVLHPPEKGSFLVASRPFASMSSGLG